MLFFFALLLALKSCCLMGTPQFWAEDGKIFFLQARTFGIRSLFMTYAGYFHLGTRLLAYFASFFRGELAPTVYFWLCFGVHLLVMFAIYASPLFRRTPARILAALATIFVPLGAEPFFNVTNIHWHLSVLLPILAIGPRRAGFDGRYWICLLSVAVIGLTDPYVVVFAPLFLLRMIRGWKDLSERILGTIAILCACVQMLSVCLTSDAISMDTSGPVALTFAETVRGYAAFPLRYILGIFRYPWRIVAFGNNFPTGFVALGEGGGIALFAGCLAAAFSRMRTQWRFLLFAGFVLAVSLGAGMMRGPFAYRGERYYLLPYVYTAFILIGLAFPDRPTGDRLKSLVCGLLGLYLLVASTLFVLPRMEDLHWKEEYRKAKADPEHVIPIHPTVTPRWGIRLPSHPDEPVSRWPTFRI